MAEDGAGRDDWSRGSLDRAVAMRRVHGMNTIIRRQHDDMAQNREMLRRLLRWCRDRRVRDSDRQALITALGPPNRAPVLPSRHTGTRGQGSTGSGAGARAIRSRCATRPGAVLPSTPLGGLPCAAVSGADGRSFRTRRSRDAAERSGRHFPPRCRTRVA